MKLQTLIIDDEPIALQKLRNYVNQVPFLELAGACLNGVEAGGFLATHEVDVIFTDINMPDMNGLDFVDSLTKAPLIVFISAYADYAVDSYRYSAVDYLLKPYGFADFQRAANKVLLQYRLHNGDVAEQAVSLSAADVADSLFVKVDYSYRRVSLSEIRYIKGCGEYLQIFTVASSSPLMTLSSFAAIKEKLNGDFIQVHRSYVVNMNRVASISKNRIIMDADTYIPIGDSYRSEFREYLASRSVGVQKK